MIWADGHDPIDKRILPFDWFKVVQIEDGVKPHAEFMLVVLVLRHCKESQYFKMYSRKTADLRN